MNSTLAIIKNPQENMDFILYNHLYARKNKTFTLKKLVKELLKYHIHTNENELLPKINEMVGNGLVIREYQAYVFVD